MSDPAEVDAVDEIVRAWRRERPDLNVESIGIVTRISRFCRRLEQRRIAALGVSQLDESMLDLLSTLRRAGPPYELQAGELARRSLITTGAVSHRLERAARAGYVTRSTPPGDGRHVWVSLTSDGNAVLDEAVARVFESDESVLSCLQSNQAADLELMLRQLLRCIESDCSAARREPSGPQDRGRTRCGDGHDGSGFVGI